MKTYLKVAAAACLSSCLAMPAVAQEAEVIHWWTSAGESKAVKTFADQYTKAGGVWKDSAIAGGENSRTATVNRMIGGNPPTAAQFNISRQFEELINNGLVAPLDDVAKAGDWDKLLPPALKAAVSRDGHYYAVPVGIHSTDWIWYNKGLFEKAGAPVPNTWDNILIAGEKLKAAGVVPLAFGGQPWQIKLTFDYALAFTGGPDLLYGLYRDRNPEIIKSAKMKASIDNLVKLRGLTDPASAGRTWNDAANMVITGRAGMQIMGDWAKAEFIAAGQTPEKDFGCQHGLNGADLIGVQGDVFIFPKNKNPDAAKAATKLATIMMAPDTQVLFNSRKGGIPVRTDVDVSGLDVCAQKAVTAIKDPKNQYPSAALIATADLTGSVQDAVAEFWANPSMTADQLMDKLVKAAKASN